MKQFLIGASAFALLVACGADKTEADEAESIVKRAAQSLEMSDIKLPKMDFSTKNYGQTDEVLAALKLDGSSNDAIAFENVKTSGGSAVFSGLTIKPDHEDDDKPVVALLAEKLSLDGLQMTDAGATFDRMVLSNVSFNDETEGVTLNVGDISIVEPNEAAAQFFTALLKGESPEGAPAFSEWSFDQMKLEDLTLTGDNTAEGAVKVTVGEMALGSMAEAVMGQALMSGLKVDFDIPSDNSPGAMPFKGSLNFDKFAMSNFRADMFDNIPDLDAGSEAIAEMNAQMMESYTSPIDQGFDQVLMEGLTLDMAGLNVSMPTGATKVARDDNGIATGLFSPKAEFSITPNAEGGELGAQVAQAISMLGYDSLNFSTNAKASYDPETKETRYSDYTLEMADGFALSFKGGLFNLLDVVKAGATSSGEPDMDMLKKLTVSDMEISLEDKSIVDRAFKVAAEMQGMEPEQLKGMASGLLAMGSMQAGQSGVDMAIINQSIGAVSDFIQGSKTLTIKMDPETPINFGEMEDPSLLTAEKLGFSAESK